MQNYCDLKVRPIPRSSKISNALKKSFIDMILTEKVTIKQAAKKFRVNYSTAKVIYRRYKQEKRRKQREERNIEEDEEEYMGESYQIGKSNSAEEKRRCGYQILDQLNNRELSNSTDSSRRNQIMIISTVAWDFFEGDIPIIL